MTVPWNDPRISRGMTAQLSLRRKRLEAGEKAVGWKLAFGGPAAMQRLGTNAPLVGFLTGRSVAASGAELSLVGWKKPAAEPELAVYIGKDLPADSDRSAAAAAISALGPAIEIADVDHPSDDVEGTLARNIYQRHVIFGRKDLTRASGMVFGLNARVLRNATELADTSDFESLTGELINNVRHVANLLAAFGETLQAGQIIIAGSIIPPIFVEPGEEITFCLEPIDTISVRFAPRASA